MDDVKQTYHIPVLLDESINGLNLKKGGVYVDVTFGGGGHSKEILKRMDKSCKLYSFDQDEDAENNIVKDKRFTFVRSNFRYLKNFLRYYGITEVDGILADLGVSSHHFDDSERGFSFRLNSRKLASTIVKRRAIKQFDTIGDFLEVVKPLYGKEREKKELAKVFQALRIEVNQEMEALKEMLVSASEILKPGGRLSVITYHSLEDRMVKNMMKTGNIEGKSEQDFFGNVKTPFKIINNKVIVPSDEEIETNPRSRSAKLRIAEKK